LDGLFGLCHFDGYRPDARWQFSVGWTGVNDTQKNKTKKNRRRGGQTLKKKKKKKNRRTGPPSKQYRSPGHTVDSFACEKITVVLKKKQKKTITYIPGVNHKTFVWFVWLNSLSSCLDAINSAAVCKSSPCVCVYKSWRSIIKVCVCVKEMLAVVVVVVVHDGWAGQILFLKRNHGDFSYM
jgi:hypothetical protein